MFTNIKRIKNYLTGLHKEFLERGQSPKYPLLSLPKFNRKIWGLKEGNLTVIASRTSMGKSSFALQCAYDLASQNTPTLFLSLEMTVEQLIERLFCNVMEIDNYDLLTGKFVIDDKMNDKWKEFGGTVSEKPLLITCGIGKTFKEINSLVAMMNPPPKAVFIDYIQEIKAGDKSERELMDEYLRRFREEVCGGGMLPDKPHRFNGF